MRDISAIILTLNEELHIERCIESLRRVARVIYVVDCFSTDATCEIAERLGACIVRHKWEGNHAKQFNWALANLPIESEWILRLDADEYLTGPLISEIDTKLDTLAADVNGVIFPRGNIFLGRRIRHGGTGKVLLLRLFRRGRATCEARWMDEHIELLEGRAAVFENEFIDHNLNNLSWWTAKHNGYAVREAIDLLDMELGIAGRVEGVREAAERRSHRKESYARKPLFWRSAAYFCYRYILRFGFLDGRVGFVWHFMQGWWYRTLVDATIFEIKRHCGDDCDKIRSYLKQQYNVDI